MGLYVDSWLCFTKVVNTCLLAHFEGLQADRTQEEREVCVLSCWCILPVLPCLISLCVCLTLTSYGLRRAGAVGREESASFGA